MHSVLKVAFALTEITDSNFEYFTYFYFCKINFSNWLIAWSRVLLNPL